MKCCSMRTVGASLLCLCILIGLSGCLDLLLPPHIRALKNQQEEQMRQFKEAQQQMQKNQTAEKQHDQTQVVSIEEQDRQAMGSQKPIEAGEQIPESFAQALLVGDWKGTLEGDWKENACDNQTTLELKMATRTEGVWDQKIGGIQKVKGVFRSSSASQQANPPSFEANVHGQMYLDTGFLSLTSRISQEEESNMRYQIEINKKAIEKAAGGLSAGEYEGSKGKELRKQYEIQEKLEKDIDKQAEIRKGKGALGPLRIDVGRNKDGSGLAGVIAGGGFAGCPIVLRSERGFRTDKLPPITREVILARDQNPAYFYGTNYSGTGYWQDLLAKYGKEEDFFLLGEMYEARGKNFPEHPEYYERAVDYYQKVVEKYGDARAQAKLGGLYENGLGVSKNPVKAQELYALARETRKKALGVCVTPASQVFARRMMKEAQSVAAQLGVLLQAYTGWRIDSGNIRVVAIDVVDVASLDKPFYCNFIAQRINPQVDAELVPDGYYYEGPYGDIRYEDNSLKKGAMRMGAVAMQKIASVPFNQGIRVEPHGKSSYKLIWKDQFIQGSETVMLN